MSSKQPPKDFKEMLRTCVDVVADALNTYEMFFTLRAGDTRQRYKKVFSDFHNVFKIFTPSVFAYLILSLYKLGETGGDKGTIHRVLAEGLAEKIITADEKKAFDANVAALKPIWIKVGILRNELIGHINDTRKIEEIFAKAEIKTEQLKELAVGYADILCELAKKGGGEPVHDLTNFSAPVFETLKQLLEKLNQ